MGEKSDRAEAQRQDSVLLPVSDPQFEGSDEAPISALRVDRRGLPPRVLLIDDSDMARAFIARMLRAEGIEVFEQPAAIGASKTILRNDITTVILDLSMPGLSGDRLITVLRSNPRLAQLFVVVVTGRSEEEIEKLRDTLDADVVLSKSSVPRLLLPALRRARRALSTSPT